MTRKPICFFLILWYLLPANTTFAYDRADSLRGSNGPGRDWWDVKKYKLRVEFDMANKEIHGANTITFKVTNIPGDSLQIDLQEPMTLDSIVWEDVATGRPLWQSKKPVFNRDGNAWWIKPPYKFWSDNTSLQLTVFFHGSPRAAVHPPWDGGFSWTTDSMGKPWVAVSCQGLGASVWWPCKDAQWDEPDNGMDLEFVVHDTLACVSNGRLQSVTSLAEDNGWKDGQANRMLSSWMSRIDTPAKIWRWHVQSPINNYNVTFYIGDYVNWEDTLMGENGKLDLSFWALRYNEERARAQFAVVKPMLHCFEYWMGPYPFYEDGYKLVEAPYLGMEHQSAIAYGNKYKMGYLGRDRSLTNIGMSFDYIIVHESGHEWFGNNITARDMADNWIHESITTYSESLFAESLLGKEKAKEYCRGEWQNIRNDIPMIGDYGVNKEGSGDIYDKGAAVMHMIRTLTNDDEKFREMLRGLNHTFYHQEVSTQQIENFIMMHTDLDLTVFFEQYLRSAKVPKLQYNIYKGTLNYRFIETVDSFTIPLLVTSKKGRAIINPSTEWKQIIWTGGKKIKFSPDFLFKLED